ncbi:hypothetical protein OS493_007708 [Desmophyllum pertusum]|uniref:Uncharacterized protein n=1 Tax=Desmophyllum pertusum TaxID=174260 RepID=A0A9X0CM79_9CNID|nr:hypothetical protein OS493_007708 [Desmophyllum pertusum]
MSYCPHRVAVPVYCSRTFDKQAVFLILTNVLEAKMPPSLVFPFAVCVGENLIRRDYFFLFFKSNPRERDEETKPSKTIREKRWL